MNILFIHGNSLSTETFVNQINSVLTEEHQLWTFDLEECIAKRNNHSPQNFFDNLKADVIELHQLHSFDLLVGHSFGGHLAIECLPELKGIKGIVIFGTPPMSKPPQMDIAYLPHPALMFFFQKELNEEQIHQMADGVLYQKQYINLISNAIKNSSGVIRKLTPAAIATSNYNDEVKILQTTKVPIMVVQGEHEGMVNGDYFQKIDLPTLWQNKVQLIADAAHCPQLEQPEQFNKLLSEFIDSL
jgi:pimeloyl-ACP methyl ester carboxylesterase